MMQPNALLVAPYKTARLSAGKATGPEFVPPVVSELEAPVRPRKKRDISTLVAEIRAQ